LLNAVGSRLAGPSKFARAEVNQNG
jgi:hypothetical protein